MNFLSVAAYWVRRGCLNLPSHQRTPKGWLGADRHQRGYQNSGERVHLACDQRFPFRQQTVQRHCDLPNRDRFQSQEASAPCSQSLDYSQVELSPKIDSAIVASADLQDSPTHWASLSLRSSI